MSLNKLLSITVAAWAILVLGFVGARLALFNAPLNLPEIVGWLLIGCTPAAIAIIVVRSRPAPSVSQVLYDVEHPTDVPALARKNDVAQQ